MTRLARLNIGCGANPPPGMINVDIVALPGVHVIADLDQPWPFADGAAAQIIASHVFEHLAQPVTFMREAHRVLIPDGTLDIRVPYYRHVFAFTDPTHKRFCTELTWDYWIPGRDLHTAYGAGFGSGDGRNVYSMERLSLNGYQQEELQAVLVKEGGEDASPALLAQEGPQDNSPA